MVVLRLRNIAFGDTRTAACGILSLMEGKKKPAIRRRRLLFCGIMKKCSKISPSLYSMSFELVWVPKY